MKKLQPSQIDGSAILRWNGTLPMCKKLLRNGGSGSDFVALWKKDVPNDISAIVQRNCRQFRSVALSTRSFSSHRCEQTIWQYLVAYCCCCCCWWRCTFAQFPAQQGSILFNRFAAKKANVWAASTVSFALAATGDARQKEVRCKTI